jgi:hypothetical protein
MKTHTLPYSIDPTYLPVHWKTEYTANYIPLDQLNMRKKLNNGNNSKQIKKPFSQYKSS